MIKAEAEKRAAEQAKRDREKEEARRCRMEVGEEKKEGERGGGREGWKEERRKKREDGRFSVCLVPAASSFALSSPLTHILFTPLFTLPPSFSPSLSSSPTQ